MEKEEGKERGPLAKAWYVFLLILVVIAILAVGGGTIYGVWLGFDWFIGLFE